MSLSVLSLFLVHLALIIPLKGAAPDEVYKGRRWTNAGGEGPYSLVVSADDSELRPAESIGYALVLQEKKMAKTKTNDELLASGKTMDKYDKVTERLMMKESRKRQRLVAAEGSTIRKRRRNPGVSSTTGLPQTMSYNLYNHFRPLDSEVPSDAILPFLDFGRKLSTGATPGHNSLDASSSAPRTPTTTPDTFDVDDVTDEEMDVAVQRKAVERNTPPRLAKVRKPTVTGFFRKPGVNNDTLVNIRIELETNKTENRDLQPNESGYKPQVILSPDYGLRLNKTYIQNNLNVTSAEPPRPSDSENRAINETATPVPQDEGPISETLVPAETNVTPKIVYAPPIKTVRNYTEKIDSKNEPELKNASTIDIFEREKQVVKTNRPLPEPSPTARILSTAVVTSVSVKESSRVPRIRNSSDVVRNSSDVHRNPSEYRIPSELIRNSSEVHRNPSELIHNSSEVYRNPSEYRNLSEFIFNSSEVHRNPSELIRNSSEVYRNPIEPYRSPSELYRSLPDVHRNPSELHHRVNPHNVSDIFISSENRTAVLQSLARRKFTTFRPKTTSFRAVTFRSTFRRNASAPVVVHVVSTPPSYIEVPRISPVRSRTTPPSLHHSPSEIVRRIHPQLSAALTAVENRTSTTPATTTASSLPVETEVDVETTETTKNFPVATTSKPSPKPEIVTQPPTDPTVTLIEFRPLDHSDEDRMNFNKFATRPVVNATTPKPFNLTVANIPDLLWVYGQRNNQTPPPAVASTEPSWGIATYVLVALGIVPIVLGALILVRQILLRSKKKVLDESEYSSEYNRSPLPTKLPRLPAHINWEESKPPPTTAPPPPPVLPPSSVGTKWEFSRDKMRLQTVLGQGNFGQVWKAEADDISGHEGLTRLVAVKTVKEGASPKEKEDLLRELGIMQELGAHPNVVTLLGCCTEKEPYLLIMEYVMYGKLLAFLREHRTRAHYFNFSDLSSALNSRDLTVFSYCVARGMEYLVSKGIIHRDLAARNILVDHNKLCKIADFGMSRNVRDTGEIYEQRPNRGALPIRWMAPESLHYNLFTHKSDVWSFGVLLWEIVTLGSTPYSKMGAREVMRQVLDGYRLERPKHCKAEFFKVLAKCWHNDSNKRPSFTELKSEIGNLLGTSESEGRFVDLEAMAEEMVDQDHH